MTQNIDINIALPPDPGAGFYTIARAARGDATYGLWSQAPSSIALEIEPHAGPSQFVFEWDVADDAIPASMVLRVVQGIRDVAEQYKLENNTPLTGIRVTAVAGDYVPGQSTPHSLRRATMMALEHALADSGLVRIPGLQDLPAV